MTYKKERGYCPGVAMKGKHIVYVEKRNGNSTTHVLQHETIVRMAKQFAEFGVEVDAIRTESASFTYEIIKSMDKVADRIFVKARMTHAIESAITDITQWKKIEVDNRCTGEVLLTLHLLLKKLEGTSKKPNR